MSPTAPALYSNKATNGRRGSVKIEFRVLEVHEHLLLPWQVQNSFRPRLSITLQEENCTLRSRDATLETALTIIADLLLIKSRVGVTAKLPFYVTI